MLALQLATDRELMASIRHKLAASRATCALFDTDQFRRHMEAAYETMVGIWRSGKRPRSFYVGQGKLDFCRAREALTPAPSHSTATPLQGFLVAIKSAFGWAERNHRIKANPVKGVTVGSRGVSAPPPRQCEPRHRSSRRCRFAEQQPRTWVPRAVLAIEKPTPVMGAA